MNVSSSSRLWRIAGVIGVAFLCALAAGAGLAPLAAAASPIYVRVDGHDANCDGTVDAAYPGSGSSCAVRTIQQGITLVDPGGTVVVGAGVYAEYVNTSKDMTLMGAGAGSTIIDGGGSSRVVFVSANVDVTIADVTIRNGGVDGYGAGIYVPNGAVLTLTGSTVSDNTASGAAFDGGGLHLASGASAVISNCSFVDNRVGISARGAGISNWGNPLTVVGSTFTGNNSGSHGGAIYSGPGSSLTVIESTFSDNMVTGTIPYGGAIWHASGTLIVSNTTIFSNSALAGGGGVGLSEGTGRIYGSIIAENWATNTTSCYGGGVYNAGGTLTIEDSVVRDNRVSGGNSLGGGIFNDGRTTLNRVTVSGNSSDHYSGGIHSQGSLTMTNVTISGNSASDTAGGLYHTSPVDALGILVNCTVASNTLSSGSPFGGGGIQAYSTVNMTNTVLAYNDNANCGIGGSGSLNSYGHNLEDSDSCDLGATGDITGTDPLLRPLGYYGGPVVGSTASQEPMRLQALRGNSPAIDQGDDAGCPAVDQRGVSRPVDGDKDSTATCDMGAYEFNLLNDVFMPVVLKSY